MMMEEASNRIARIDFSSSLRPGTGAAFGQIRRRQHHRSSGSSAPLSDDFEARSGSEE